MSRAATMQREKWRVQVVSGAGGGRVTHESLFGSEPDARAYYDALDVPGHTKRIERREAGESRFTLRDQALMVEAASPARLKRWVVARLVHKAAGLLDYALRSLPDEGWSESVDAHELALIINARDALNKLADLRKEAKN